MQKLGKNACFQTGFQYITITPSAINQEQQ